MKHLAIIMLLATTTACGPYSFNRRGALTCQEIESKNVEKLIQHGRSALERGEPLEMREVLTFIEDMLNALVLPDSSTARGMAKHVEPLVNLEYELRQSLQAEIETRVGEAHEVALAQDFLSDSMQEWQVASFYLGLLPDAESVEEASLYQEYLTEHEQVREKILRKSRVKYSIWAVEEMKKYVQGFDKNTKWYWFDDPGGIVAAGINHLGPIDTSLLTMEAASLYNSLLQDSYGELDMSERTQLISGIEKAEKKALE